MNADINKIRSVQVLDSKDGRREFDGIGSSNGGIKIVVLSFLGLGQNSGWTAGY